MSSALQRQEGASVSTEPRNSYRFSPPAVAANGAVHTRGPWHLVTDRRSNGNAKAGYPKSDRSAILLICGKAGAPVVSRRGIAKPSQPEGRANACLMAAAPDLLSALEGALADNAWANMEPATLAAARAAVAKAKGAGQ